MSAGPPQNVGVIVPVTTPPVIYTLDGLDREFRQGEIICGLSQRIYNPAENNVDERVRPYSVVLNQDCDLLQDYNARNSGKGAPIESMLFYIAEPADDMRGKIDGDIWKRVIQNNNDRYHFLSVVAAECDLIKVGLPKLIIDFKSFFTLPTEEVYRQCVKDAQRRTRLEMPYREHLQNRAAFYFQRIVLPEPHPK